MAAREQKRRQREEAQQSIGAQALVGKGDRGKQEGAAGRGTDSMLLRASTERSLSSSFMRSASKGVQAIFAQAARMVQQGEVAYHKEPGVNSARSSLGVGGAGRRQSASASSRGSGGGAVGLRSRTRKARAKIGAVVAATSQSHSPSHSLSW